MKTKDNSQKEYGHANNKHMQIDAQYTNHTYQQEQNQQRLQKQQVIHIIHNKGIIKIA